MADGTSAPKGALITGLVLILLAFGGCGYGCVSGAGLIGDVANAIDSANTTPLNQPTTLRATGENGIILTSDGSAWREHWQFSMIDIDVSFFSLGAHVIWGATAAMLTDLFLRTLHPRLVAQGLPAGGLDDPRRLDPPALA